MSGFRTFDGIVIVGALATLITVILLVRKSYLRKEINVFQFIALPLILVGLIVRAFFFLIDTNNQNFDRDDQIPSTQSPKLFAYLFTFPMLTNSLAAQMIALRWSFDHKILHENIFNTRPYRVK